MCTITGLGRDSPRHAPDTVLQTIEACELRSRLTGIRYDACKGGKVRQRRVLLVEDNFDNRSIYSEILRHAGYEVIEATNGMEGVQQAVEQNPDLILMDLSMPVMDGWEAIQLLKQEPRTAPIPVLALSAHVVVDGNFARSRGAGFAYYLTKPIEPKDVLREVNRWLEHPP